MNDNDRQDHGTRSCHDTRAAAADSLVRIGRRPAPATWKTVEERRAGVRPTGEFPGGLPPAAAQHAAHAATGDDTANRRDFLSLMGFSLAAAAPAACRAPVQNAVPLPTASDTSTPGVSNWYASTCGGCAASCALLIKQRDGRPLKIEGNTQSHLFGGGVCATGQATVLSLYDEERLRGPLWHGRPTDWAEIDRQVGQALNATRGDQRKIVLLSGTINSPSLRDTINSWGERHPTFRHITADATSFSGMRVANAQAFGRAVVPHYAFDRARVIVGFEADFLGTWLSPVEFARQYALGRRVDGPTPLHVQIESGMSVTGSNADVRIPVAPSQLSAVAVRLLERVARRAGVNPPLPSLPASPVPATDAQLDTLADALWKHRGAGLVVSGSNDVAAQSVVNAINSLLGNIGATIDLAAPSLQRQGDDAGFTALMNEMERGDVRLLLLHGVNPAYDHPEAPRFLRALAKVPVSISFSDRLDETSARASAVCPDHHFLEAWGDAEPVSGHFSLAQPIIAPLFSTRAAGDSLRAWLGDSVDGYAHLREFWRRQQFPRQQQTRDFDTFWDDTLRDGVAVLPRPMSEPPAPPLAGDWRGAAGRIADELREQSTTSTTAEPNRVELHLHESVALREGRHANNPWLQELPDPISKVTWGNVAAIAPSLAKRLGVANGDVVSIRSDTGVVDVPVFVQPGQHPGTISVAVGYGRQKVGPAGNNLGVNVHGLTTLAAQGLRRAFTTAVVTKTGRRDTLASTQTHFSMEDRPIVLHTTRAALRQGPAASDDRPEHAGEPLPTLWKEKPRGAHSWGMAIDLNACTGCSACVVACQAENNVAVIGKDQVRRSRIMHWLRIDQYYSGPEDNPTSVHQPMMCQHCANAPCETVCPVLATTTSSEGLNQQVYNRCIGTRYCANNCPYKVRRFNWHDYTHTTGFPSPLDNPLGRMVLNPDVTVRTRGVMEKCSLCVQRIQLGKNQALQQGRTLSDGDVQTACQQTCPTQAIVFGDLQDPDSRVSRMMRDPRAYRVLEDLGTRPNVGYLKKVRADDDEQGA